MATNSSATNAVHSPLAADVSVGNVAAGAAEVSTNAATDATTGAGASALAAFCNSYGPKAVALAELFIYLGLIMGVIMAAAEAFKLYREALAVKAAGVVPASAARAASPAVGEVIKSLAGVLTGAKAWLALVIVGVLLFWLAGASTPDFCTK